MSDLISRQAAIDALHKYFAEGFDGDRFWNSTHVLAAIKELPSAQPEIIRCKDCEHWDTSWQNDYSPNYHYCPLVDGTRRDDFYCADAERRTDG